MLQQIVSLADNQLEHKKTELSIISQKFAPAVIHSLNSKMSIIEKLKERLKAGVKYTLISKSEQIEKQKLNIKLSAKIKVQKEQSRLIQSVVDLRQRISGYYSNKRYLVKLQRTIIIFA